VVNVEVLMWFVDNSNSRIIEQKVIVKGFPAPSPTLFNPKKSLIGSIRSDQQSGAERCFRYATLSSGLDIVRKTLSQHEIATARPYRLAAIEVIRDQIATIGHTDSVLIANLLHSGGR
jgi:hypothetical protein